MITERVADVALDPRTAGAEALFTYRLESPARIGDAVFVPISGRQTLGYITSIYEATEADLGFPFSSLKGIYATIDGLSLPAAIVEVARFVAEDTLCSLPVALSSATPPGVRDRLISGWAVDRELLPGEKLPPAQMEILTVLKELSGVLIPTKNKPLAEGTLRALRALRKLGVVRQTLTLQPINERREAEPMLQLIADSPRVETFLRKEGKRKPAQALTIMCLQAAEHGFLTSSELRALAGVTETTVKALTTAGLLQLVEVDTLTSSRAPTPNPPQQLAIDAVTESVRQKQPQGFLLFGITGSGKTEVYLRCAAEALRIGRQVLYLVPEIALAAQAIAQLRDRFGRRVAVIHSDLPAAERLRNWVQIRDGEASVIVGARSALFAPANNLGLIVLDEEHEASYKQEASPRYHAKRVAEFLAKRHQCPLILGSATPSVESFFEAEGQELIEGTEGLTLLSLPTRTASARLPQVEIRDLTLDYKAGSPAILSAELRQGIQETLERREQAILFLNRRAYSPFIICRDCGHQMACPHCAVSLSWHRRDGRLRCHHCGFSQLPPDTCPNCAGIRLNPFGIGTEKVEESVRQEFPEVNVARLDRDVARVKGTLENVMAGFRAGDIQVLVGTQMIAKGLDFPNVTMVGVIAADISLNIPDFRSAERTFQLLSQVAGRAGRGAAPGRVIIQTFNPNHPAIVYAQNHDFMGMYETLKQERAEASYPPYCRLTNVMFTGEDKRLVEKASTEAATRLKRLLPVGATLLGPADCAVERIQNRWRRHLLLKFPPAHSSKWVAEALLGWDPPHVQFTIDVDPFSLM